MLKIIITVLLDAVCVRVYVSYAVKLCHDRECNRTQGVSTTDLVGRMLLMTKAHHSNIVSTALFSLHAFSEQYKP